MAQEREWGRVDGFMIINRVQPLQTASPPLSSPPAQCLSTSVFSISGRNLHPGPMHDSKFWKECHLLAPIGSNCRLLSLRKNTAWTPSHPAQLIQAFNIRKGELQQTALARELQQTALEPRGSHSCS
jgi:hypothetical protein